MTNQTETIEATARMCLVEWATNPLTRTVSLKKLASALVDLRATHVRNSQPDWAGRSFDYRAQVSKIMGSAGLSDADRKKVTGLLRYHVGNELRERLSVEELQAAGLQEASPKQRVLNSKGRYGTVDAAVEKLAEAVEVIQDAAPGDITSDHLLAIQDASQALITISTKREI